MTTVGPMRTRLRRESPWAWAVAVALLVDGLLDLVGMIPACLGDPGEPDGFVRSYLGVVWPGVVLAFAIVVLSAWWIAGWWMRGGRVAVGAVAWRAALLVVPLGLVTSLLAIVAVSLQAGVSFSGG